jgi:hypothetical protein
MAFLSTTSDLIEAIKNRAHVPDSQSTYTDARMLSIASDELLTFVVPMVLGTHEDYYVTYKDYAISGTSYTLPARAIGGKLRDVVTLNGDSLETPIRRVDPSQQDYVGGTYCWLRGNKLLLSTTPTGQSTLRLYYHTRPNRLIELTSCGRVTAVGATTIDLDLVPSTFTTSETFDVVSGDQPHPIRASDLSITNVVGTTITFATLPDVEIGDYFCLAGESPVVQAPYETVPLLAQRVACKIMEAEGDLSGLKPSLIELDRMEKAAFKLLEPRIDGQNLKIIGRGSDLRNLPRRWGYIYRT